MSSETNSVNIQMIKKNKILTRITLIVVLSLFALLLVSTTVSSGAMALIAKYWKVEEDSIIGFALVALAISIVVGVGLAFAYSALMIKTTRPYLDALQKIAECDFSVRIKDSQLFAGFGLAERFNEMASQLGSVETLREDFVSNFSHEFKTPIVSISGFATLLKSPNLSEKEREEYLNVIIDESNRLVRLSERVLMLTRLDSQTVVNEKFLLDEQIRQSMLLFERACTVKNIEMTADLQKITVENEKKLLSQIWVNLLSNAVKFTPNGGKIEVIATQQNSEISVSVKDNGCGMSEETKKNIFNKFYQGDTSHATEGNGLGLSVVKKICDLLKIKIDVQSALGQGSTFTVTFNTVPSVKNYTVVAKQQQISEKINDETGR